MARAPTSGAILALCDAAWALGAPALDSAERPDRQRLGAADAQQVDPVARWRDDGGP